MSVELTLNVRIVSGDEERASSSVTVGDDLIGDDDRYATPLPLIEKPIVAGSSVLAPGLSMRSC